MTDALGQAATERAGQQILTVSGPQSRQIIAGAGATKVVGRDRAGRPLLEAAGLRLRLETPLDLPAGGRLQLLLPQGVPWPRAGGLAPAPDDRAVQALLLRQPAPGEPRERDGLRLPAADHALAARLLRWIEGAGASASGAAAAPESEPDAPLPHAPTKLGRQTRESQPGCWRVLLLPLGFEDPIPLRLYLRDPAVEHERHPRPQHDRTHGRVGRSSRSSSVRSVAASSTCSARQRGSMSRCAAPSRSRQACRTRSAAWFGRRASFAGWAGRVEFRIADLLPLPEARGTASQQITA